MNGRSFIQNRRNCCSRYFRRALGKCQNGFAGVNAKRLPIFDKWEVSELKEDIMLGLVVTAIILLIAVGVKQVLKKQYGGQFV